MRSGTAGHRSTGIDGVRGLLVLGVILGHFFEITEGESFPAWIGAGLRMPLFIGLTGYLFNLQRARADTVTALLRRYYPRLILPWIVACLVHVTLTRELHIGTPLSLLLWPPFHLWFVPVMMTFILIAAVSRWTPPAMLGLAIPVSIGAMYLLGVGHLPPALHHWMPDRRFFIYPVYFFYGARTPADLFYLDRIAAITAANPQITFIPVLSHAQEGDGWTGAEGFVHVELAQGLAQGAVGGR